TRAGSSVLLSKDVDANPADEVATTTFEYRDWDPSDHTKLVTRHARFTANPTETWSITAAPVGSNGYSIAHFNTATGQWATVDGVAIQVAVGPNGQAGVVHSAGQIWSRTRGTTGYVDGTWLSIPGAASQISVGADGSVWAIGTDAAGGVDRHIYYYHPT